MSNLVEWAKEELDRLNKDDDGMQNAINKDILQIVKVFSEQGHSGFSASYALGMIKRLLDWKPILPLTGEEDEWKEPSPREGDKIVQQKNVARQYSVTTTTIQPHITFTEKFSRMMAAKHGSVIVTVGCR